MKIFNFYFSVSKEGICKWFYMMLENKANTSLEFNSTILLYLVLIYKRI